MPTKSVRMLWAWGELCQRPRESLGAGVAADSGLGPQSLMLRTQGAILPDAAMSEWGGLSGMERETGFEPATSTLARLHSTS